MHHLSLTSSGVTVLCRSLDTKVRLASTSVSMSGTPTSAINRSVVILEEHKHRLPSCQGCVQHGAVVRPCLIALTRRLANCPSSTRRAGSGNWTSCGFQGEREVNSMWVHSFSSQSVGALVAMNIVVPLESSGKNMSRSSVAKRICTSSNGLSCTRMP